MHEQKAARRITWRLAPAGGGVALVFLWAIAACAQNASERRESQGATPRLPGGGSKAPAYIGADAPFDVAKFFAAVPAGSNAAPLYLDALFEFGSELEICFPEGPVRTRRSQASKDRAKRYNDLSKSFYDNPKMSLDPVAVDEVIKLYNVGFQKLAEAQRRERCVFEAGIGSSTLLPHAQVSRQVFRISSLRLQRALQRGDFPAVIREVETVLRLARDLRPRGVRISQYVGDAISQAVYGGMVPTILASPRLRAEHCERLIKALSTHEAKSIDGFREGTCAQYLVTRATLDDLVHHQRELAKAMGLKPGESVVRALMAQSVPNNLPGSYAPSQPLPDDCDAVVAAMSTAQVSRQVKDVDRYFRALLSLDGMPYAKRIERILALKPPAGSDPLSSVIGAFMRPVDAENDARSASREKASLHADCCLLALRRWQFSHQGSAKDLTSIIRGSGLKTVPTDPYDGKPIKLALVDGRPLIYSVGRDGADDGGLIDSNVDQKPAGDLLYHLPRIEEKLTLKP